jgi:hypothetical protein
MEKYISKSNEKVVKAIKCSVENNGSIIKVIKNNYKASMLMEKLCIGTNSDATKLYHITYEDGILPIINEIKDSYLIVDIYDYYLMPSEKFEKEYMNYNKYMEEKQKNKLPEQPPKEKNNGNKFLLKLFDDDGNPILVFEGDNLPSDDDLDKIFSKFSTEDYKHNFPNFKKVYKKVIL